MHAQAHRHTHARSNTNLYKCTHTHAQPQASMHAHAHTREVTCPARIHIRTQTRDCCCPSCKRSTHTIGYCSLSCMQIATRTHAHACRGVGRKGEARSLLPCPLSSAASPPSHQDYIIATCMNSFATSPPTPPRSPELHHEPIGCLSPPPPPPSHQDCIMKSVLLYMSSAGMRRAAR